jgi:Ca2+-binding EF-hand superfamily protein
MPAVIGIPPLANRSEDPMSISSIGGSNAASMMQQMRERLFTQADSNQSGGLSLDEFKAAAKPGGPPPGGPPPGGAAGSAQGTANAAGTAASSALDSMFNALDTDGDGSVSQAELAAGESQRSQGAISSDGMSALLAAQEDSRADTSGQDRSDIGQAIDQMIRKLVEAYGSQNSRQSAATSVTA